MVHQEISGSLSFQLWRFMEDKPGMVFFGPLDVRLNADGPDDTLRFADMVINRNIVAVVEVEVSKKVLDRIGDFIDVDSFIFEHGTVVIWETDLGEFNGAIIRIVHKF